MRRFAMMGMMFALILGVPAAGFWVGQDEKKPEAEQKTADTPQEPKTDSQTPAADSPKTAEKGTEASFAPPPLKPVPPEVEAKLEAARRAVAEAIIAAQDAGLVETTIDPPPILDILILGQANDKLVLQAKLDELKANPNANPEAALSVEVFGAWFAAQGVLPGVDLQKNIKIMNPSKGLIDWYAKRAEIINRHLVEARKAKGEAAPAKEEAKAAEPAKEEAAAVEEKKDEAGAAEQKKDETAGGEEKKDEGQPEEN